MKKYTDTHIEDVLSRAVKNSAPDILPDILSQCVSQKGYDSMDKQKENRRPHRWRTAFAATAAALVLCVAGFIGVKLYAKSSVDTVITLDVNPSIKLEVNTAERIVDCIALNDDAKTIIDGLDLKGVDMEVAAYALIGSMLEHGYISDAANSVLITVQNSDAAKAGNIEQKFSDTVSRILQGHSLSGAILAQSYTTEDSETEQLAKKYGISFGKAQLITKILAADPLADPDALAPLSINELNLLYASKGTLEGTAASGTASTKNYIDKDSAVSAALSHSGIAREAAKNLTVEFDYENGRMTYDVEFISGTIEYEYEIDAVTGEVLDWHSEADDDLPSPSASTPPTAEEPSASSQTPPSSGGSQAYIGSAKAKEIAIAHAGASNYRDLEAEFEYKGGKAYYEVSFEVSATDYDYNIDALTGEILYSSSHTDTPDNDDYDDDHDDYDDDHDDDYDDL